ncbi:hypothetical protein Tco_1436948 [Tanacetum coccineum]
MGVTDPSSFVRSLSNIWVGNFHLYVSVARFQRPNPSKPNNNQFPRTSHPIPNPNFSKPNPNPNNYDQQSFASIVHGNRYPKPPNANNLQVTTCAVTLDDKDLIGVDDTSRVLLVKLKDLDSVSNMYVICKNEGFVDFKIHHVGGSWIWIQFPSPEACENFRVNATMISISSAIRTVTLSFKVDQSTSMSTVRVCISPNHISPFLKKVKVNVHGNTFDVLVHEIGTWSFNIEEEVQDSSSSEDMNKIEKVADTFVVNSVDDLDEVLKDLNNDKDDTITSEEPRNVNIEDLQPKKETNTSVLSCPPDFKNFKRDKDIQGTSKCSTAFPRRRNKDIKGISFIHELSRLIEVGSSLGIDVRGYRRSLNQMINGIGA